MNRSPDKIKIGYLLHGDRNIGGGEKGISLLIKGLDKTKFEAVVFFSKMNRIIAELQNSGIVTVPIRFSPRITSVYRDSIRMNPWTLAIYFWHFVRATAAVYKALREHQVALLHPHDNLSKIIGGVAAKCAGIKLVTHCRDQLNDGPIERLLGYYQVFMMDQIISNSEAVKSRLPFNGQSVKIKTVYNGIDLTAFDPTKKFSVTRDSLGIKDPNATVLAIVAVFDKLKGHEHLFNALIKLKGNHNFICLVVGNGREKESLQHFVAAQNLTKEVLFLGFREDVADILSVVDILVIASEREALPRVALEAMAMGIAIAATNVGGIPEAVIAEKTGLLVEHGDANQLSAALEKLILSKSMRQRFGLAGRAHVLKNFSLGGNINQIQNLYVNLLKEKPY